jgi:hypothetical protein
LIERCVSAFVVNMNLIPSKGFDHVAVDLKNNIFTLCDGANSCPNAGDAAKFFGNKMLECIKTDDDDSFSSQFLNLFFNAHHQMQFEYLDSACTFLYFNASQSKLKLSSMGDSFLYLFQKPLMGFGNWKHLLTMPRDIDGFNHPSQLVGSEVCHDLHLESIDASGIYCAILMSDGPGNLLSIPILLSRLKMLGRKFPSSDDLLYLCQTLAREAEEMGCRDDNSIAIVWAKYSTKLL